MPLPAKEVELYIEKKLAELINAQQNKEVDKLLRDLKSYNRSLKRHPTDANVYSLMAIAYIELAKQFTDAFFNEAALLALNKANELSPNNPIHLADRMTLCAEMGGYELTEKDLKTLCDLDSIPIMELAYTLHE
jgi:tetratricopeptide (TPR) repeat protein